MNPDLEILNEYFSHERMEKYVYSVGEIFAVDLYKTNLKVSQSFYPLLNILETVLRNKINKHFSDFFKDSEWLINQKNGFMNDVSLKSKFLKSEIERTEYLLKKRNSEITMGKMIAEQNFSFWTEFFSLNYYKILKGQSIKIFGKLPIGIGRKEINQKLKSIRIFRNRLYHNEPICFKNEKFSFYEAKNVHQNIIYLIDLMAPELKDFIEELDSVEFEISFFNS